MLNSVHVIRTCDPEVKMKWHNVYKVVSPYRQCTHIRCLLPAIFSVDFSPYLTTQQPLLQKPHLKNQKHDEGGEELFRSLI